jgi:hypothetical protein
VAGVAVSSNAATATSADSTTHPLNTARGVRAPVNLAGSPMKMSSFAGSGVYVAMIYCRLALRHRLRGQ